MKLTITYSELQDYVASHFHKTVNLGYVDGATVSASVPIKVLGFTKSVSITKDTINASIFIAVNAKKSTIAPSRRVTRCWKVS